MCLYCTRNVRKTQTTDTCRLYFIDISGFTSKTNKHTKNDLSTTIKTILLWIRKLKLFLALKPYGSCWLFATFRWLPREWNWMLSKNWTTFKFFTSRRCRVLLITFRLFGKSISIMCHYILSVSFSIPILVWRFFKQ